MGLNTPFDPYGQEDTRGATNPAVLVDKMIGTAYDVVKEVCLYLKEIRHLSANMAAIFRVSSNLEQLDTTRVRINVTAPSVAATATVTLNAANGIADPTKIVGLRAVLKTNLGLIVNDCDDKLTVSIQDDVLSVSVLTGAPAQYAGASVVVFIEIENE